MSNTASTAYWDKRRGKVFSKIGGWRIGEGVFSYGLNLVGDIAGTHSFMQVHLRNLTGRHYSAEVAAWCEMVYVGLSWPDTRIWCNQIAAYAGETHCSTSMATAAAVMAADSRLYGGATIVEGCAWLRHVKSEVEKGATVAEVVDAEVKRNRGKVHIKGYARPIANGDERVTQLRKYARDLGFEKGVYEQLGEEVEQYLLDKYGESMNLNGIVAAFLSDQGFSGEELFDISAAAVFSGATACYTDAVKRPFGSLMPLRCDDIEYCGKPKRALPEAAES